ncbi:MAG: MBL fold metallo-hydrolase [Clostridia bacterium]|nr:MBL fold metallo-hydrolase [Clostridia bacterium]
MARRKTNKTTSLVYLIIALILGAVISHFSSMDKTSLTNSYEHVTGELSVHFVDVGQADCQVILLPDNKVMMIDAGNNDDATLVCDYLDNLGIEKIDYLVGTHPHEDHIGSLDTVINNYEVENVYMPDAEADNKTYRDVKKALSSKNLGVTLTSAGTTIYSDEDLKIEAVAPVYYYDELNNSSIVIHLTYKDASFLFTGDAEEESENDINGDISADVLSVGHHGSSTSTSDYFLERVDPMYAVISCGANNDYGHPHWETLEKLENDDITIYRTDRDGTLICTTKGAKGDYSWQGAE